MNIFKGKELYLRTLIYIIGVVVYFSYWRVLGFGSALVGATIVKGALVLLGTDLTGSPLRSTLTFITVFIYIGLFSFLASLNIFTGLIINFITIFVLAYNFSSNIKQTVWRPFILGYLYLLVEPGIPSKVPSRLIALALGGLFVMLTQIILNRNKSKKSLETGIKSLFDEITVKINSILLGEHVKSTKYKIVESVDKISTAIYSKRIDPLFITRKDNTILNIALCVERLNYLLKEINIDLNNSVEKSFMVDLKLMIEYISVIIGKKKPNKNLLEILNDFINKHKELTNDNYYLYEILQNIEMLRFCVEQYEYDSYKKRDIVLNRKLRNQISKTFKFNLNRDSIRFTFAFRISLLLAVSYFIVNLFKIPEGKWIVFTIYAVLEPIFESTNKRMGKRFKGTLIGIFIFILIYILVKNIYLQGLIFIILYYLYIIEKDFGTKTIFTATVSLGLFSIVTDSPSRGILYRISFVGIGIIIGYLGNKYIMPYDSQRAKKRIIDSYYSFSMDILNFVLKNPINTKTLNILNEKIFFSKLYESKLIFRDDDKIKEFIYNQRSLNNTIYFLMFSIKDSEHKKEILNKLKNHILCIDIKVSNSEISEKEMLLKIKHVFKDKFSQLNSNEEKLAFMNLERILLRMQKSNDLMTFIWYYFINF